MPAARRSARGALQLNNSAAAGAGTITLGDANTGGANVQLNINDPAVANGVTVANPGPGTATISYLLSGSALTYGSTATWTLNQPAILTVPNLTAVPICNLRRSFRARGR